MGDDTGQTLTATGQGENSATNEPREPSQGDIVGRYVLLSKLGAGGMGVVYAAYDPELDRKVAVKMLLPREGGSSEAARSRLLREAQALAKLSHPNVVAVHDVGTYGERVWLAMEYVSGHTLGEWGQGQPQPRRWSECLRVLIDVVRGVVAAHAAGLVHRDLKPDNVMVDHHGRVRVMDFGLAHGRAATAAVGLAATMQSDGAARPGVPALALRLTRADALQGTPAYMAPEQWSGEEAQAQADQFGWSVMAWELLYGERPFSGDSPLALANSVLEGQRNAPPRGRSVPKWLRRVLERGLATRSEQRWPTMAALQDALERGRQRGRQRTGVLALAGVGMLGAVVAMAATSSAYVVDQVCSGGDQRIAEIWSDQRREALHTEFLATNLAFAPTTWPYVATGLERWANRWSAAYRDACEATRIRGEQSEVLMDARVRCLSVRLLDFRALLEALEAPDRGVILRAPSAVDSLPRIDRCADASFVSAQVEPPDDAKVELQVEALRASLAEARSDWRTGRYAQGLERAKTAQQRAAEIGYGPATAEAELLLGLLQDISGDRSAAEQSLRAAYFDGLRYELDEVSAQASAHLISVVGLWLARVDEGREWAEHASAMIDRDGGDDLHSFLAIGRALLFEQRGQFDEALASYQDALALARRNSDSGTFRAAKILGNMGIVYNEKGEPEAAAWHIKQAIEGLTAVLGENHPDVARSLNNLAMSEKRRGHVDAARDAYKRAIAIYEAANGADSFDLAAPVNNLANIELDERHYPAAIDNYLRAISIEEKHGGSNVVSLAYPLTGLAQAEIDNGDPASALVHARRALALRQAGDCTPSELAFAKFTVARAGLAVHGEDKEAFLVLARDAETAFAAGREGTQAELEAVRELLTEHAG